ncbi:sugar ABC transporter substrate-binding protein [Priestia flexa]|uniref:Sugar ABC transporter substrate-binding protein n=1 Tax=Priestia flexa TaxID=86664 RepID=A0ABU4J211_9BACI|nr:sugar ABC transporter substrate-binding protein [Priestia flexa]MCA1201630.1 sugar ABC transporter substrate-binding protein [Priestia flexa]MDW8514977.1 sugar ABC transporter substrate-binding protein [Priestia flexa]
MKYVKKWYSPFILLLFVLFVTVGCTNEQPDINAASKPQVKEEQKTEANFTAKNVSKDTKVALIAEFTTGTHAAQYISGATAAAKEQGIQLTVSDANNDQAKMAAYLDTAINQNVDGIIIKHGRSETLEPGVKRAVAKGIPVVAFDVELDVDGVTTIDQDDYMLALQGLKQMMQDINGEGKIVYIFVGGFAPMEKRNTIYEAMLERYPDVEEVARFGNATSNTSLDTQTKMAAILKKYPNKGDITAVWAPWDEFAKGATRAIKEAGRDEIKVYGVDLSDEDLQMMQEENSPWKASAAVNPAAIGEKQVEFVLQRIAGQDIPRYYSFNPTLITQDDLPDAPINMDQVGEFVEAWNQKE